MRKINSIVIHQSDSDWGDANEIRKWHLERNFSDCGYHAVILNGHRRGQAYNLADDGKVELGRPIEQKGAHCIEANATSLGICLIGRGDGYLTSAQDSALFDLLHKWMRRFNIPARRVMGHYEYTSAKRQGKTCPGIPMEWIRARLIEQIKERDEKHGTA